jgi:hypothetical protein
VEVGELCEPANGVPRPGLLLVRARPSPRGRRSGGAPSRCGWRQVGCSDDCGGRTSFGKQDCTLTSVDIGGLDARLQRQFSQVTVALSRDSIREHCGAKPPPTDTS